HTSKRKQLKPKTAEPVLAEQALPHLSLQRVRARKAEVQAVLLKLNNSMKKNILRQLIMLSKRIMYAFLVQLMACTVLLANTGKAQRKSIEEVKITLNLKEKALQQFFEQVESKTDFKFTYNDDLVDLGRKITIDERNRSLYTVLETVSRQAELHFVQVNNNIHVKSAEKEKAGNVRKTEVEDLSVSGVVTDANGEPIPGVTVSVQGTSLGTATDISGRYTLTVPEGSTLVFSFIGFITQSIAVEGRSVVDVVLQEDMASLDEVIVVGYGVQKKANLTGSVASINLESLENRSRPVTNVSQILNNAVPGLQIMQSSGQPNGESFG